MVTFKKDSFVIEIPTGGNPIEDWLLLHDELCGLLQCVDPDMTISKNYILLLELLRKMMPDWETAKKMTK